MPLSTNSFVEAPMNSITIYDTDSGQWRTQRTSGPEPTSRIRHSATLCMLFYMHRVLKKYRERLLNIS